MEDPGKASLIQISAPKPGHSACSATIRFIPLVQRFSLDSVFFESINILEKIVVHQHIPENVLRCEEMQ